MFLYNAFFSRVTCEFEFLFSNPRTREECRSKEMVKKWDETSLFPFDHAQSVKFTHASYLSMGTHRFRRDGKPLPFCTGIGRYESSWTTSRKRNPIIRFNQIIIPMKLRYIHHTCPINFILQTKVKWHFPYNNILNNSKYVIQIIFPRTNLFRIYRRIFSRVKFKSLSKPTRMRIE